MTIVRNPFWYSRRNRDVSRMNLTSFLGNGGIQNIQILKIYKKKESNPLMLLKYYDTPNHF